MAATSSSALPDDNRKAREHCLRAFVLRRAFTQVPSDFLENAVCGDSMGCEVGKRLQQYGPRNPSSTA